MRLELRELRLRQLERTLTPFYAAKLEVRPKAGWLRGIREALGLSMQEVGKNMGKAKPNIQQFEKSESDDRITLGSLRRVAHAMDCELVYAIVPRSGTLTELAERHAQAQATRDVHAVERTMALEDQAPGGVDQLIEDETKRRRRR